MERITKLMNEDIVAGEETNISSQLTRRLRMACNPKCRMSDAERKTLLIPRVPIYVYKRIRCAKRREGGIGGPVISVWRRRLILVS